MLACCLLLTGCGPEFTTPIKWGNAQWINGSDISQTDPMKIVLGDSGEGYVRDFPQGVSEKNPERENGTCVRLTSEERYTGKISWKPEGEYAIKIEFKGSSYFVGDGRGKFGSQTWRALEFTSCGSGTAFWHLSIECGDAGTGHKEAGVPACDDAELNMRQ